MNSPEPASVCDLDSRKIADAKELFSTYGARNSHLIVREMRARGWQKFSRADLLGRPPRGRYEKVVGMIEAFGWKEPSAVTDSPEPATTFRRWLAATKPDWYWNWKYQSYIYKRLARLHRGRTNRLMVFMPPRHGKSELITIRFAVWTLITRPQTRIIIGSYNQKLANRFSRQIRRLYEALTMAASSDGQAQDLPLRLLNTADEWETAEGGGVKAVGAGAGVTGFGADLIIIDDPIKGRADAESKNNRDRVWEWYSDDLHTRLEPNGRVILIQTRWHQDDLAGRLLNEQENGGEKWEVVKLPALAEAEPPASAGGRAHEKDAASENFTTRTPTHAGGSARDPLGRKPGEALCPARFSEEALEAKRKKLGSYSFSALYQQDPVPADGNVFKRAWFSKIVERAPDGLRWFRAYDLAISTKTSADYTASARLAQDKDGTIYIADIFRKRIEYPEQLRYITGRIEAERGTEHGIESALHGTAFVQELRRNARLSSRAFRGIRVDKDKLTRCLAWANRAEEGKVVLVRGPWIADFIDEACAFPNGRHDDQIDAVSLAVEMITMRKHVAFGF